MAKKNRYEGMFLLKVKDAKEDWDRMASHVTEIIEGVDGSVTNTVKWDERKLTYDIKGQSRAAYLLAHFEAPPEGMNAVRHRCKMSQYVLRELILRSDNPGVPLAANAENAGGPSEAEPKPEEKEEGDDGQPEQGAPDRESD